MVQKSGNRKRHSRVAILATLLAMVILAFVIFLIYSHRGSSNNQTEPQQTAAQTPAKASSTNTSTNSTSSQSSSSVPPSSYQTSKAYDLNAQTSTLLTPTGNFVSDHRPSSSSFQEQSVCNTSPGATCYIQFTQGSTTIRLDSHPTDVNGSAFWTWDINQVGLTSGTWYITAVASLNGQTKSANDSVALVVP